MRLTDKARQRIREEMEAKALFYKGGFDAFCVFVETLPDLAGSDGYESRVADKVTAAHREASLSVAELRTALDEMGNVAAMRREMLSLRATMSVHDKIVQDGIAGKLGPIDPVASTLAVLQEMGRENPAIFGELGVESFINEVRRRVFG